MNSKKVWMTLTFASLAVLAEDMNVKLIQSASTIIIARKAGLVERLPLQEGSLVSKQSLLLSSEVNGENTNVYASSDGILIRYGENIKLGSNIELGDFIAEILNNKIQGMLRHKPNLLHRNSFDEGGLYCCLYINDKVLPIQISNSFEANGEYTYYFTSQTQDASLLEQLNKNKYKTNTLKVDFKYSIDSAESN